MSVPRATTDHENAYNFGHKRRGLCVIINNVEFDPALELNDRSGSDADATGLEKRFRNLEFEVRNYRNARTREMLGYLRDGTLINGETKFYSICSALVHSHLSVYVALF